MTVQVQDVLLVDAVFLGVQLLENEEQIAACGAAMETEIVQEGVLIGGPQGITSPTGRTLRLLRERILVETAAGRTRVVKEYPRDLEDALSLSKMVHLAAEVTGAPQVPTAFGFNIHILFDQSSGESAIGYLGKRLFSPKAPLYEEWNISGGFGRLFFQDGPRRWSIQLEPRHQDLSTTKVFLNMNLHVGEHDFPSLSEMEEVLVEMWGRAHHLIEAIDHE